MFHFFRSEPNRRTKIVSEEGEKDFCWFIELIEERIHHDIEMPLCGEAIISFRYVARCFR